MWPEQLFTRAISKLNSCSCASFCPDHLFRWPAFELSSYSSTLPEHLFKRLGLASVHVTKVWTEQLYPVPPFEFSSCSRCRHSPLVMWKTLELSKLSMWPTFELRKLSTPCGQQLNWANSLCGQQLNWAIYVATTELSKLSIWSTTKLSKLSIWPTTKLSKLSMWPTTELSKLSMWPKSDLSKFSCDQHLTVPWWLGHPLFRHCDTPNRTIRHCNDSPHKHLHIVTIRPHRGRTVRPPPNRSVRPLRSGSKYGCDNPTHVQSDPFSTGTVRTMTHRSPLKNGAAQPERTSPTHGSAGCKPNLT